MVFWEHIGNISKPKANRSPKSAGEFGFTFLLRMPRLLRACSPPSKSAGAESGLCSLLAVNSARLDRAGRTPTYVYLYRAHVSGTLALHHSGACNPPFWCVSHTVLVLITHRSGACSTPLWCI